MKRSVALTAACLCLAVLGATAMTLAPANAQTLNFAPAVQSPEVSGDGRVTLRLKAPNAQSVMVRRGGAPQAMAKARERDEKKRRSFIYDSCGTGRIAVKTG